jgi:hypothetical protein
LKSGMGVGPNNASSTVSTIDVKTRTKHPNDIAVGAGRMAVTPDGKTAYVAHGPAAVSTIDVKTRTEHPNDITVGALPNGWRSRRVAGDGRRVLIGCGTTRRLNDARPWSYPGHTCPHARDPSTEHRARTTRWATC